MLNKTRIAIVGTELAQWTGGIDFLVDFINVFQLHPEKYDIKVFLYEGNFIKRFLWNIPRNKFYKNIKKMIKSIEEECEHVEIISYKENKLIRKNRFADVKKKAKNMNIDVLIPMNMIMEGINDDSYITVAYIYDMQHKYLPELFDESEIKRRDEYFSNILQCYDFSFTQSYDTLNDIKKYYGNNFNNIFVMYAYPHKVNYISDNVKNVREKYGLTFPYFIVCNQFWAHKNHKIVFEAFEVLFNKGYKDFMVVCTGDVNDYRNVHYFYKLKEYIFGLNCRDNIKILGYIEKKDQVFLLVNSIALIQPTLFEGNPGGGAVVDAEAYGVPCIVSDIPVNKEIPNCYDVTFFETKNSLSLSEKMIEAINKYDPKIVYESKADYEKFYKEYDNIINEMIELKKTKL